MGAHEQVVASATLAASAELRAENKALKQEVAMLRKTLQRDSSYSSCGQGIGQRMGTCSDTSQAETDGSTEAAAAVAEAKIAKAVADTEIASASSGFGFDDGASGDPATSRNAFDLYDRWLEGNSAPNNFDRGAECSKSFSLK